MRVEGDVLVRLRPDGSVRGRSSLGGSARWQGREVSHLLTADGVRCWVNAVIVVWGDMTPMHTHANDVDWVAGKHIADWLMSLSPTPKPEQVAKAAQTLLGGHLTQR